MGVATHFFVGTVLNLLKKCVITNEKLVEMQLNTEFKGTAAIEKQICRRIVD